MVFLRENASFPMEVAVSLLCSLEYLHVVLPSYSLLNSYVAGLRQAIDENRRQPAAVYKSPAPVDLGLDRHIAGSWMESVASEMPQGLAVGPPLDLSRVLVGPYTGVLSLHDLTDLPTGDLSYRPSEGEFFRAPFFGGRFPLSLFVVVEQYVSDLWAAGTLGSGSRSGPSSGHRVTSPAVNSAATTRVATTSSAAPPSAPHPAQTGVTEVSASAGTSGTANSIRTANLKRTAVSGSSDGRSSRSGGAAANILQPSHMHSPNVSENSPMDTSVSVDQSSSGGVPVDAVPGADLHSALDSLVSAANSGLNLASLPAATTSAATRLPTSSVGYQLPTLASLGYAKYVPAQNAYRCRGPGGWWTFFEGRDGGPATVEFRPCIGLFSITAAEVQEAIDASVEPAHPEAYAVLAYCGYSEGTLLMLFFSYYIVPSFCFRPFA